MEGYNCLGLGIWNVEVAVFVSSLLVVAHVVVVYCAWFAFPRGRC